MKWMRELVVARMLDCVVSIKSSDQVKRVERRSEHCCGGAKLLVTCDMHDVHLQLPLSATIINQMLCTAPKESSWPHLWIHATGYLPLHRHYATWPKQASCVSLSAVKRSIRNEPFSITQTTEGRRCLEAI